MVYSGPARRPPYIEASRWLFAFPTRHSHFVAFMSRHDDGNGDYEDEPLPRRSTTRAILIVATCTAAMIVNVSNGTSSTISLPVISRDLGIPEARLQWIISAYSLASGCLLLFFGRIADLYGRRRTFIIGSAWLSIFSLGCGFSKNSITLSILRGFQGVGGAITMPSSIGILSQYFPPSRARSIAFATFAAGAPVGGAFGYLIGGILTQFTSTTWRSSFYVAAGLAVSNAALAVVSVSPDERSTESDRRVDWIGALLVTAGLVLIFFVLGSGEVASRQWATPYLIALLILGVILIGSFIAWQWFLENTREKPDFSPTWMTPPPLMKLSLWSRGSGRMAAIMAIALLNWCAFIGWNFWQQLYYQRFLGLSTILTAVRLLPMFVTGVLCNVLVAFVVSHIPIVYLLGFGTLITSCAALLFAEIDPAAPYWAFGFPAAILSVVGSDFTFSSGTLFIARAALPHEQSVAGALFQTMIQLGTALGVTITTVVFDRVFRHELVNARLPSDSAQEYLPKERLIRCYRAAQWAAFGFGVVAMVVAIACFRGVGVVGHRKDSEEDLSGRTRNASQSLETRPSDEKS